MIIEGNEPKLIRLGDVKVGECFVFEPERTDNPFLFLCCVGNNYVNLSENRLVANLDLSSLVKIKPARVVIDGP